MKNIQDEVMKIHHQYGTTEMANYQIQLLFDRNYKQLENRIKELENNTTELAQLQFAEQQFIGYSYGRSEPYITTLVDCMGLKEDEWLKIKDHILSYVTKSDIEDIEDYFKKQRKTSARIVGEEL